MSHIKRVDFFKDYTVTNNVLGRGSSGEIRICINKRTQEKYALKILKSSSQARLEINMHLRLSTCPHVVKLIDVYENIMNAELRYLLVMELMRGGDLFDRMQNDSSLTERDVAKYVHQMASSISFLHSKNIAHRDLKPENFIFSETGPTGVLKLTDFGFAREVLVENSLKTPCSTHYFVPPEILNHIKYDKSCDLWSLGVTIYIVLSQFPPFYSETGENLSPKMVMKIKSGKYDFPEAEWADVSADAKDLITKLLITDPDQRLSIDQVMEHPWVAHYDRVPNTLLRTDQSLTPAVREQINETLSEELNRRGRDNSPTKPLKLCTNTLFQKRMQRHKESSNPDVDDKQNASG